MKDALIKPIPVEYIAQKIMLDADLADFYDVPVKRLNEQVKRNLARFPSDFMFQLSREETDQLNRSQIVTTSKNLKSQIATSSWGGKRKLSYAFTEHGVVMLASVLRSQKAAEISIFIVRAFVRIREILSSNKELAFKIQELEREQNLQNKYINALYSMFDKLLDEPIKPPGPLGFRASNM